MGAMPGLESSRATRMISHDQTGPGRAGGGAEEDGGV